MIQYYPYLKEMYANPYDYPTFLVDQIRDVLIEINQRIQTTISHRGWQS